MYSAVQEAHSASQPPVVWLEPNMKVLSPPLQQFHRDALQMCCSDTKEQRAADISGIGGYGDIYSLFWYL